VIPKSERTLQRFFDTSVFARPAQGTIGNAPKDVIRGPGINNWDISIYASRSCYRTTGNPSLWHSLTANLIAYQTPRRY
jgi:hypothetical protein